MGWLPQNGLLSLPASQFPPEIHVRWWKNERSIDLLLGQKTKSIMHTYTSTSQFFLPHPLSKKREKLNCSYGSRQLNVRQIQSEWRISITLAQYVQSRNMNKLNLPKLYNNYLKPVPRLWDLGIGNFTPSAFPGFEWVRNNKSKQIYWRFQKPPYDQSHFASLGKV